MSIQKITQSEILENGVRSLSTRPSTPSLYSGNTLSAEELKAAFDKLPILIAERFNALLLSTGLFDEAHPADTLSDLIATGLDASHSLSNFFEDVKNGNLALYLAANGEGDPLADVLAELKRAIEAKKSCSVSVEGEGDLLTEASLVGDHLILKHGARIGDILAEAKAYADAPTGTVSAACTKPVSGDAVYGELTALKKGHEKRIASLENAAKDILYTYPIVNDTFSCTRSDENVLPHAALLKLGAVPLENYNRFPEQLLHGVQSGDLTITWDEGEKVLVFNGTLHATESPLNIIPFNHRLSENEFFSFGLFYRGGSVSTEGATLSFVSSGNEYADVPLSMENFLCLSQEFKIIGTFRWVALSATEDTVFDNYRVNLFISYEQRTPHYETFCSENRFILPKKLICSGPNTWNGASELEGEGYVSFSPSCFSETGCYIIGFAHQSTLSESTTLVEVYAGEESVHRKQWIQGGFKSVAIYADQPITEVRVYAGKTKELSTGQTVKLESIYVHPTDPDHTEGFDYLPYHRDELLFPDSFARFSDRFFGYDAENCNYFDFEVGSFLDRYQTLRVDGTLQFEEEDGAKGLFSAPFTVPDALQNGETSYQTSAVFEKKNNIVQDEQLWFTSDRVFVKGRIFVGKEASAVKHFFNIFPIDVVYRKSSSQRFFLSEEESDFKEAQAIELRPSSHLFFYDKDDALINAYSQIQYQMKQTTEETV